MTARDRHEDLGAGQIGLDLLVRTVADAHALAGAPAVAEAPGDGFLKQAADIALLRERLALL